MTRSKNRKHRLLESPFPLLLRTSDPITDEEHNIVVTAVTRVQLELDSLAEIQRVQGETESSYRQRLALEDFLQQHNSLLHWPRRVPADILIDIFFWCTEDNTLVPFNISHVCKRWRCIALATPQLWRKVPIPPKFAHTAAERRFARFLASDYSHRSENQSLIFLWHPYYCEVADKIWDTLALHVNRWGDVQMVIDQQNDKHLFKRIGALDGQLHSLYALKLTIMRSSDDPDLRPFASAPRLRYLEWKDTRQRITTGDEIMSTGWPWSSLTHMSVFCARLDCIDPAIFYFRNLTYLRLRFSLWGDVMMHKPIPAGTIVFESCVYLHVELDRLAYMWWQGFSSFFTSIYCPSLTTLAVKYLVECNRHLDHHEQTGHVLDLLSSLIQRHSPHLKSLNWSSYTANCRNTYTNPDYPPIVDQTNIEKRIFDNLTSLSTLRMGFPSHKTLTGIMLSLRSNRHFLPSLRKLDILIDPHKEVMGSQGLSTLCHLFELLVRRNETFPAPSPSRRPIDEIRIEIVTPSTPEVYAITPWDLVVELDAWKDKLLGPNVLEFCLCSSLPLYPRRGRGALVQKELSLRRFLIQYLHEHIPSNKWYSRKFREPLDDVLGKLTRKFLEDAPNRKWTVAGLNSVIYVPPDSPLRKDDTLWAFGVSDYALKDPGFLDEHQVPLINPTWLASRDLTHLHPFA
ncbi:hypothetical protein D9756_010896 [Leucocoprinus leucothites]|uniref:F-box domain-containing protein n=1 Tax=Leucocoprinus leucothites TaxID=201217 RepID=A0A8H5FQW8_9AGAR|nr:hypothetical protein D9756_010896 [Leucoagaricus leucothites]